MVTNTDKRKWRQIRISAVSTEGVWQRIRVIFGNKLAGKFRLNPGLGWSGFEQNGPDRGERTILAGPQKLYKLYTYQNGMYSQTNISGPRQHRSQAFSPPTFTEMGCLGTRLECELADVPGYVHFREWQKGVKWLRLTGDKHQGGNKYNSLFENIQSQAPFCRLVPTKYKWTLN